MKLGLGGTLLGLLVLAFTACSSVRSDLEMPSSFDDPSEFPYVILTPDRKIVYYEDSVEIAVTFINPTRERIKLPSMSSSRADFDRIAYTLSTEWNGSFDGRSYFSVFSDPPNPRYLEPRSRRSYKIKWNSDYDRDGEVILTYSFGSLGIFPPTSVTLATQSGGRHTEQIDDGNSVKPLGDERTP